MSTDLYGIRVLEIEPEARRLRLRVFVVYYETTAGYHQPIPSDRSFFARVLMDKNALGDDIAESDRFDEDYVNRNAFRYIERFEELSRANYPVKDYEDYHDFYYERDGSWTHEEKLVRADFDVFVTRAEYLRPLQPGVSWGTTAYQTESDDLSWDEYEHVPDFSVVHSFKPFGDLEKEASTVDVMSFSENGDQLLVANNLQDIRIFSTEDWSLLGEILNTNAEWNHGIGLLKDGRVAVRRKTETFAVDIHTHAEERLDLPGVIINTSPARYLVSNPDDITVLDEKGQELFRRPCEQEIQASWLSFDQSGNICAVVVENTPPMVIDTRNNTIREMPGHRITGAALTPDGSYLLVSGRLFENGEMETAVISVASARIIRRHSRRQSYITAVAWSPNGRTVLTSWSDQQGYNNRIYLHDIGAESLRKESLPIPVPPRENRSIADLARLYVERTMDFYSGWDSHLDDDLLDFHVTLVGMGHSSDLVDAMRSDETKIAARAYESVIMAKAGKTEAARNALENALEILEDADIQEWNYTYVYGPLAASYFVLDREREAIAALKKAHIELDDESNEFQKHAIMARSLLFLERRDEIQKILRTTRGDDEPDNDDPDDDDDYVWIEEYHARLLNDFADAMEMDLLSLACKLWKPIGEEYMDGVVTRILVQDRPDLLLKSDIPLKKYHRSAVGAWLAWFRIDSREAERTFQEQRKANPDSLILIEVLCHREPDRAAEFFDLMMEDFDALLGYVIALFRSPHSDLGLQAWKSFSDWDKQRAGEFARRENIELVPDFEKLMKQDDASEFIDSARAGRWEEVYAFISQTRPSQREELFQGAADAALDSGDIDIALDLFGRLSYTDMNSPGVRALANAFRKLAGHHFREYHP